MINKVHQLEARFGGWWTGIKFHRNNPPGDNYAMRPMRFCEAITESRTGPIVLSRELLDCLGGRRSLGWSDDDEAIAQTMANKASMDIQLAREIIQNTPRLQDEIVAVTVGTDNSPDVVISYAQPKVAMKLLRQWQRVHGGELQPRISSFMAVCGSVAVRAHLSGQVCMSFGCPDSRDHGKIGRDRLAIGLPFQLLGAVLPEKRGLSQAKA